jgi:ribonuclease BN (tRNA processing enzyme)
VSRWLAAILLSLLGIAPASAEVCGDGVALQVLGSGGPELQGARAASGYTVWIDGKARVLVDVGAGVALRFAESGATMADLDVILLSHVHADHTADLPALIQSSWGQGRTRPLPLFGPEGSAVMPSTVTLVRTLFDNTRGAYRHLGDLLSPRDRGPYKLRPLDVPAKRLQRKGVRVSAGFGNERLRTASAPVVHGDTPAVAWQVIAGDKRIVFAGDTNDAGGGLPLLARGADIMVLHHAILETASPQDTQLYMRPSTMGRIAAEAGVKQLVLSHRMVRTLGQEAETLKAIRQHYAGPVSLADDLACFKP